MLEIQMLGNPNLVADGENCLEEVKEIGEELKINYKTGQIP